MPKTKPTENVVLPNSQVSVNVPWTTVQPVYEQVLRQAAQKIKADGFRQGKVPPHIAEKMLKPEAIYEQVIEKVLPAAYSAVLKESKKLPISRPEVEPVQMEKGQDWTFTVYFAEQQPVKLGNYQSAVKKAVEKALKEVTKESTEAQKEDLKLKHIFKQLVETIQPKVQELLIRTEVNREVQRLVDQLRQLNLKVEDYLNSRKISGEQLQQEYAATALTSLQIEFILAEIAREQKLTVEEKEIDDMFTKIGGDKLTPEQRRDSEYRSYIFSTLLKQKVVKHLLSL